MCLFSTIQSQTIDLRRIRESWKTRVLWWVFQCYLENTNKRSKKLPTRSTVDLKVGGSTPHMVNAFCIPPIPRPGFTLGHLGHLAQGPPAFRLIGGPPGHKRGSHREPQFDEILRLRQLKPLKFLPPWELITKFCLWRLKLSKNSPPAVEIVNFLPLAVGIVKIYAYAVKKNVKTIAFGGKNCQKIASGSRHFSKGPPGKIWPRAPQIHNPGLPIPPTRMSATASCSERSSTEGFLFNQGYQTCSFREQSAPLEVCLLPKI